MDWQQHELVFIMFLRHTSIAIIPSVLCLSLSLGCSDDTTEAEGGSETAGDTAGDGDTVGDEVGEESSSSGGGETTSSDSSSSEDEGCPVGAEGCPCTPGGGCDPGLMCEGGTCTEADPDAGETTEEGTTEEGTTEEGTTEEGETTTTGGGGGACMGDEFIEVELYSAELDGWTEETSMLGEGEILAWDQQTNDATATWTIDIPCDDTWHIWVRGWEQGQDDSYFAQLDGEPNPDAIFELDCTGGPQQSTYEWVELNWRDQQNGGPCEYEQDPWTADWDAGAHTLTLGYRESIAISEVWITNTTDAPN
ncbi:hypothetical protein PPSIR1_34232 [Plesiocystis pacifica SIR-1]|uniref:Uncharacterized protein n=2 Tax=Plesiocystis pacifica TaxID=191768 RepID=A6G7K4_9BACT|nr:hypothetical protein PPSIR1_34232 [Plesiocystis pacifica SIR-1]